MDKPFTHLHVHTGYSLLDGSAKIDELVARAKELGMDSLAITDHGVMYGAIEFYNAAKEAGIKPIIGCEVYVASGSRLDKSPSADNFYYHLVLLAENMQGYYNLVKIVSAGFTEGFYRKPRVDTELLEKYHEGIIASSACLAGPVARDYLRFGYSVALETAKKYSKIFGENNFFLELQDHGIPEQKEVNQALLRIHEETGLPLVCTNDSHYINPEDAEAHDILLCIQTGVTVNTPDRMRYEGGQFYLKSPQEMYDLFPYAQEACENTHKIAERCNVEFEFNNYKLPHFDVPNNMEHLEYLTQLCHEGLKDRYKNITAEIEDRLKYELSVITDMGFVDYFLIVWDFIKYAKDNGIIVGPGRGSAAGSIVAYSLKITDIDPLKYALIFERFLNPSRVSMPDIDIDFCYERRHEVIEYVNRKYGKDQVAQIVTFGTMAARNAVRDVGRALDIPYNEVDKIAKMIPMDLKMTIGKALEESADFKEAYNSSPQTKHLIDMAQKLEGLPRHTSTHAAGVIIADRPVVDYVPLNLNVKDNSVTTQYTMVVCEKLGLLKMDFLGLRTLTVIQKAFEEIERIHGVHYDGSSIDYEDKAVFEFISSGNTLGVFQLESAGMTSFMKELKPDSVEDLIAGISLYRPGPMSFIPKYLKGKRNYKDVTYTHPSLEPILKNTYGCIIYQEQVMQIVRDLAGYSMSMSDGVRRAMSKKKHDVIKREREVFINGDESRGVKGCVANGIPAAVANEIYDEMEDFASYAFNKSHAAAYAIVAYQTAWLKTHYPTEFMAALMTSVKDRSDKIASYTYNCREMGINILQPDINKSLSEFHVEGNNIRFGFSAIKHVGEGNIESICSLREKDGNFKSLTDFVERVGSTVNVRALESLILSGCFDSLGGNRAQYMSISKSLYESVGAIRKKNIEGQMSLFQLDESASEEALKDNLPQIAEFDIKKKLSQERDLLGSYISGHPLRGYTERLAMYTSNVTLDFPKEPEDYYNPSKLKDGDSVAVGGIVTSLTQKYTKNGKPMCFITLEDMVSEIEIIVFPNLYEQIRASINEEDIIVVKGKASISEEQASKLIADNIMKLDELENINRVLWIKLPKEIDTELSDIQGIMTRHKGKTRVKIYVEKTGQTLSVTPSSYVELNDILLSELKNLLGGSSVIVK